MSSFKTPNEIILLLEGKAIHGEKLVVLTDSQWKEIQQAYSSFLIHRINEDALIFHPAKNFETKETTFLLDDSV